MKGCIEEMYSAIYTYTYIQTDRQTDTCTHTRSKYGNKLRFFEIKKKEYSSENISKLLHWLQC